MPRSEDERPVVREARCACDDPRLARAMSVGRLRRPREYRRLGTWWALVAATAVLVGGVVLAQGLLIATGLVGAGLAARLIDPPD
ncbi:MULTISPECIES: DUF3040 domain-containing protein [unclassified Streptomyces]|uniref:DUF3040 domain-containing protein n=1 Tax=unclassified Streptomyces TaxID=2593676 RepID=UPI0036E0BE83